MTSKLQIFSFFMIGLSLSTPFEERVASKLKGDVPVNFPLERTTQEIVSSVCKNKFDLMKTYFNINAENPLKKSIAERENGLDDQERTGSIVFNDEHIIFIYKPLESSVREIYAQKMMIDSSNMDLVVPITDCGTDASSTYFIAERYFSLLECLDVIRSLQPVEQVEFYIKILKAYRDINKQNLAHNAVNPNLIFFKTKDKAGLMKPRVSFFGNSWIKAARGYSSSYTLENPDLKLIHSRNTQTRPASPENKSGMRDNNRSSRSQTRQDRAFSPSRTQHLSRGRQNDAVTSLNMEYEAVVGLITIVYMRTIDHARIFTSYFEEYKAAPAAFYNKYCASNGPTGILGVICDLRASGFKGEDPYYYGNIIARFEAYKNGLEKGSKAII